MSTGRLVYRFGNFFEKVQEQGFQSVPSFDWQLTVGDENYTLTHHVQFRIDIDAELHAHVALRNIAIGVYKTQHSDNYKLFVGLSSSLYENNHFLSWFTSHFKQFNLTENTDYKHSPHCCHGADHTCLEIHTVKGYEALIKTLEGKISSDIFFDLQRINAFIYHNKNIQQEHSTPERRLFDIIDTQVSNNIDRLFELAEQLKKKEIRITPYKLLPPLKTKQGVFIRLQGYTSSKKLKNYFLIKETSRTQNHNGETSPSIVVKAIEESTYHFKMTHNNEKFSPILETELHAISDDEKRFLLYKDKKGSLHCNNQFSLYSYRNALPLPEFEWLLAHTPISTDLVANGKSSLLLAAMIAGLQGETFMMLLAYGLNPFYSVSKSCILTPHEKILQVLKESPKSQNTSWMNMHNYIKTKAAALIKNPSRPNIDIYANDEEILSNFVFSKTTIQTIIKLTSALTSEEKIRLAYIHELCFNALLTRAEKEAFLTDIKNHDSTLTSCDSWIKLVEMRFNTVMTPKDKQAFFALFSPQEVHLFHQYVEEARSEKGNTANFLIFLNKSLVRYSFYQDIKDPNKLIEIVYKEGEIIAGSLRALHRSKSSNNKIIVQGVLAFKLPGKKGALPRGFMQFLSIRCPFSLALFPNENQIPYEVLVMILILNPSSHRYLDQLECYYPKHRDPGMKSITREAVDMIYDGKNNIIENGIAVYVQENIQAANIEGLGDKWNVHDQLFTKLIGLYGHTSEEIDPTQATENFRALLACYSANNLDTAQKLNQLLSQRELTAHLGMFSKAFSPLANRIIATLTTRKANL